MPLLLENSTAVLSTESGTVIGIENGIPYETVLRQHYIALGFGSLVCWGMPTFVDLEYADPDLDPDTWSPTGLDIDQWLAALVAGGCKYATLTTKHHDGFALWPTDYFVPGYDPYSIAQTSWYVANGNPDIVGLFVSKCRSHGLAPGLYFSMRDYTYEVRGSTSQGYNPSAYIDMIKFQLTELLTNYGTINSVWFDGWSWSLGYEYITYPMIYKFVKSISPTTLVIENAHIHPSLTSQIETYEQNETAVTNGNVRLSETSRSPRIDQKWFYGDTADQSSAAYDLVSIRASLLHNNNNHSNLHLASTPDLSGVLPAAQVTMYSQIPV